MGQFSWLDCKTNEQIIDDEVRDVYVLVPEEFKDIYKSHIEEHCYDGYGHFGQYDIYDLVADWNRDYIDAENFENYCLRTPKLEQFSGTKETKEEQRYYYERALASNKKEKQMLKDFCNHKYNDIEMIQMYGKDYKRLIGINIACYDEDNAMLKYPIKITYDKDAIYEDCNMSNRDPNQGWLMEADYNEDYEC